MGKIKFQLLPIITLIGLVLIVFIWEKQHMNPRVHVIATPITLSAFQGQSSSPPSWLTSMIKLSASPHLSPLHSKAWKNIYSNNFAKETSRTGTFSGCSWTTSIMEADCSGLKKSLASKFAAYPLKWPDTSGENSPCENPKGLPKCGGFYNPNSVLSISHGTLNYTMRLKHIAGKWLGQDAALLPKFATKQTPNGGFLYGAVAVHFKLAVAAPFNFSFLLWPNSNKWPVDGEIDFPEIDQPNGSNNVSAFMHWMNSTDTAQIQQDAYGATLHSGWNTAVTVWEPHNVYFLLNGTIMGHSTQHVPSTPMHWVLQTGTQSNDSPTSSISRIKIGWLAAYQLK